MHNSYLDIVSRIAESPKWWDENAVPRYDVFVPNGVANIYAKSVALVEIACQSCGTTFPVAFSDAGPLWSALAEGYCNLATQIEEQTLHYGDPPNACCQIGATMNCEDIRVLEFWEKDSQAFEWVRKPELEITFDNGGMYNE